METKTFDKSTNQAAPRPPFIIIIIIIIIINLELVILVLHSLFVFLKLIIAAPSLCSEIPRSIYPPARISLKSVSHCPKIVV